MNSKKKIKLAIVGTDSLRGKEIKDVLDRKKIPLANIEFFDPEVKEEYSKLTQFRGEPKVIHSLESRFFLDADLVFLAADKESNRKIGILAKKKKFQAIDLSETFNRESGVPVVVAGVNDEIIVKEKPSLIANPHPVTVILSHLFYSVMQKYGISRAISFILQPVSAFENEGIAELVDQSLALLSSSTLKKKVFKDQIAFNFLPHTEKPDKDGFSPVERQIMGEIRKVIGDKCFPFSLSLVQAPVFHTYSIMTFLELTRKADCPGLQQLFKENIFFKFSSLGVTSSVSVAGKEQIFIGQIKKEDSIRNSFWVWAVADNLTRGSALNAFEIVKKIIYPARNNEGNISAFQTHSP